MLRWIIGTLLFLGMASYGALEVSRARSFQLFGEIITRAETTRPLVALTFDDGPTRAQTGPVLAVLEEHGVRGTFFLVGESIEAHPDAARAIAEAGHEIGNHSFTHPRMVLMSPAAVRREIAQTDAAIRAIGYEGPIHFRPPYGKKLVVLPWVLGEMGRPSLMWSVEPETVLPSDASAEDIAAHVIETAEPGSIILLHVMFSANAQTRAALPLIIEGLQQRGFGFATVSELLGPDTAGSTGPTGAL